jgi:hypothetical protein
MMIVLKSCSGCGNRKAEINSEGTMKLYLAVTVAALAISAAAANAAPVQWSANGHWYEVVKNDLQSSWSGALGAAAAHSFGGMTGYLATITSQAEQDFLNGYVAAYAPGPSWLGGSDAAVEGSWVWQTGPETGDALVFFNWAGGEPNNLNNEDGLIGWWSGDGWNDLLDGYGGYSYLVEYSERTVPPSSVPLPAGLPLLLAGMGTLGLLRKRKSA